MVEDFKGLIFERAEDRAKVAVVDPKVVSHGARLGSPKGAQDFVLVAYLMDGKPSGRQGFAKVAELTDGRTWSIVGAYDGPFSVDGVAREAIGARSEDDREAQIRYLVKLMARQLGPDALTRNVVRIRLEEAASAYLGGIDGP